MKLQTPLDIAQCEIRFNYRTKTLLLGFDVDLVGEGR